MIPWPPPVLDAASPFRLFVAVMPVVVVAVADVVIAAAASPAVVLLWLTWIQVDAAPLVRRGSGGGCTPRCDEAVVAVIVAAALRMAGRVSDSSLVSEAGRLGVGGPDGRGSGAV